MKHAFAIAFAIAFAVFAAAVPAVSAAAQLCEGPHSAPEKTARFHPRGLVTEESGIASSRLNSGVVWAHNDNFSPKHVFAIHARNGKVARVLDLENLPMIGHHSDFEDISVARCPANTSLATSEWCLWVADTGSNFGPKSKDILVYVIREPAIAVAGYGAIQEVVKPEDALIFKITYDPTSYHKQVPNVESMVTRSDGKRFWLIEKTFSRGGDGPAGIWETPWLEDVSSLPASACARTKPVVRFRSEGNSTTKLQVGKAGEWECGVSPSLNATTFDVVSVPSLFLRRVNAIENPYPDCRWESEAKEDESISVYGAFSEDLPFCRGKEKQPEGHSCRKQRSWGKCREGWMIQRNFCEMTCRRCRPRPAPANETGLVVRSKEEVAGGAGDPWTQLEAACNETKGGMRNIRNIAAADLSDDGSRLLVATYGGIFEYALKRPWDFKTVSFLRQLGTLHRDGTNSGTEYWKGQEGVCYHGSDVLSVSEHHQGIYSLECLDKTKT